MTIVEFLQQHGVDHREGGTHSHVRPGWIGVDCPRCGPGSGKFHAGVREDLSRAACWRCGGMSPYHLLAEVAGLRWYEVREAVTPRSGPVTGAYSPAKRNAGVVYPKGLEPLSDCYSGYLRGR